MHWFNRNSIYPAIALGASALLISACVGMGDGAGGEASGGETAKATTTPMTKPTPERTPEPAPRPTPEPTRAAPAPAVANVGGSVYYAKCGGEVKSMADILGPLTKKMERMKIPYAQDPANEFRDCSGNFLRLSSYVASACPGNDANLAAGPGVTDYNKGGDNVQNFDLKDEARDTRAVGKWYYEQGRFTPIFYDGVTDITKPPQGLIDARDQFKPGAVVWFSHGMPASDKGVKGLWDKAVGGGSAINHMATIVAVKRDAAGNVESFEMYHGLSGTKVATITKDHYWKWPATLGTTKRPPYGFWKQFVVGVGSMLPAEAPPGG